MSYLDTQYVKWPGAGCEACTFHSIDHLTDLLYGIDLNCLYMFKSTIYIMKKKVKTVTPWRVDCNYHFQAEPA